MTGKALDDYEKGHGIGYPVGYENGKATLENGGEKNLTAPKVKGNKNYKFGFECGYKFAYLTAMAGR